MDILWVYIKSDHPVYHRMSSKKILRNFRALASAVNVASTAPSGSKVYTILMTSTANPADVAQAVASAKSLNNYGGLSILTIGSGDFSATTSLSDNILPWTSPSLSGGPPGYANWLNISYGCKRNELGEVV